MTIKSRVLSQLPSLQTSLYERTVFDDRGLRAALVDIATRPAATKTILVAGKIRAPRPYSLVSAHSNTKIIGIGVEAGIVNSTGHAFPHIFSATGEIRGFELSGLILGNDGGSVSTVIDFSGADFLEHLLFQDCKMAGIDSVHLANADQVRFRGCDLFGPTELVDSSLVQMSECQIAGLTSDSTGRLTIGGCVLLADIDTSAGNGATIVGNDLNGFTITSAGGDVVASNRP